MRDEELENPQNVAEDAIAIVGMAFRFPGDQNTEEGFWQSLKEGKDLVTKVDAGRWAVDELQHNRRSEPGRSITFSAGVLSRIEEFDAEFFGISPREAVWLDPQQRLLLELAWEAMENCGQIPSKLSGSDVAVYVGISSMDYGLGGLDDLASMSAYSMTGNTLSIAANRLSYAFDFRGPSLAVDTACSSSMVALHHACNALRSGDASAALVGGVSILYHPYPFVGFTKASMLSANGRCRAFDASGDGYVRAEGGAVLFLKPLSKALADNDDIQAVILGTGVNSDGSQKTGITIPSSDGQTELMQSVLQLSGISPGDVDYIEAHGTGTPVGDPVEATAIGKVYGQLRPHGSRLPIGSVKTNVGHLEPASGMAGLVKAVLVLKNHALPPSLHFEKPNPNINFEELNLEVVTEFRPLDVANGKPLVAGVNSFGFGGANAHVLLQEYQTGCEPQERGDIQQFPPLFISGKSIQALQEMAGRYADLIRLNEQAYYDIAYTAAFNRERFEKRLAIRVSDSAQAIERLSQFSADASAEVILEDALAEPSGVAFIYSGNGAQWVGMGQRLMTESTRFSEILASLDPDIETLSGFSILQELNADASSSRLDDTAVAQPLLFAIQVALTMMLRDQGIEPAAVTGHSVGEVAAAWAAGLLSLDQAIEVICGRSIAQARTRGMGRMAAVGLSESAMHEIFASGCYGDVEIAGINSPNNITLSGSLEDLERVQKVVEPRRIFFRLLDLDYAFHSRHMDKIKDDLVEKFDHHDLQAATGVTYVSTVTGKVESKLAKDYWWHNVRQPVHFAHAVSSLLDQGCKIFVEVGPHAILQHYLKESLNIQGVQGRVLDTLRKNDDRLARFEEMALRIHLLREPVELKTYFPEPGHRVKLPTYAWQREHYARPRTNEWYALVERHRVHPILGARLKEMDAAWENTLDVTMQHWLADHSVGGAVVLPGAAYVEMALAAAQEWFGGTRLELEELDIVAPVVFDAEHARVLRFELSPRDGGFTIRSRQRLSPDDWSLNAVGRLIGSPASSIKTEDYFFVGGKATDAIEQATHYHLTSTIGLEYGPAFQRLESAYVEGNYLEARLANASSEEDELEFKCFLPPPVLDACFQSLVDFFADDINAGHGVPLLPVKVGRLQYFQKAQATQFRAHLLRRGARSVVVDFELFDDAGHVIAILSNCRFRAAILQRQGSNVPSCWRIEPQLLPHPLEQITTHIPSTSEIAKQVYSWFADAESKLDRAAYFKEALPLFEALSVSFAYEGFQRLFSEHGDWVQGVLSGIDAVEGEGIPVPYIRWLAACLRNEGLLDWQNDVWEIITSDIPAADDIWKTLLRDFPASLPELVLAGRVGRNLPDLLMGNIDNKAFLTSLHSSHPAETLYNDSPSYLGDRLAVQQVLTNLAEALPENRRLRILEISGGISELPRQISGLLPDARIDYVLAESDPDLRDRLSAEYQNHPFVITATLANEELELDSETALPDYFDAIVIRHRVHFFHNPVATLVAARRKLVSGGMLILAERHADISANFVHGLDSSWWHHADGAEPESCLLTPVTWQKALEEQGFEDIETVVEPVAEGLSEGSYLLLAKRPQEQIGLAEPPIENWLLLSDAHGPARELSKQLIKHLESRGQRVFAAVANGNALNNADDNNVITCDLQDQASILKLLEVAHGKMGNVEHVVHLVGWREADKFSAGEISADSGSCTGLLNIVHSLTKSEWKEPRIWLITSGGVLIADDAWENGLDPAQGAIWGFGRVLMNEYPAFNCTVIDVGSDPDDSGDIGQRLENELLQPDDERELVLAPSGRYSLRMFRDSSFDHPSKTDSASRFRLDFHLPGQLRNLAWFPIPERSLNDDEVEVQTMAAGLNFRDVMYTMGLLPDEAVENGFAGASVGLEFAGVVTRIGKRVREFSLGDAVMGFGPACFSSHVVTKAVALADKPAEWSFEEAATVPTVFFTVYYALVQLANLQKGERILIHGAAGGVGIAAIQMASYLGAEIFATAGSNEKRDFVHLLGADHVFDSRSLDFADRILEVTGGEGVDVVLNSLAGEAIRRNLRVLRPFGRFLELGKRDFFENTPIGLRPFKDNISYFGIDADQLLVARPDLAGELFREVMTLFREGILSPLPYRAFPAGRVIDAFRTMQQSRHIGKVVVALEDANVEVKQDKVALPEISIGGGGTYFVTGGLAGFGLETARWLVQRGARNLVLLGRRGLQTPGAEEAVAELEALGVRVTAYSCDITDRNALESIIQQTQREMPPLKGILHAAMVLDDALITNLDVERFTKVLLPKLLGAKHLHELTLDIPIDHFILYSSVTTYIGNPGQANYVAANAYLEVLANLRRSLGLPVTCIGWGPIGDVGYLTRNESVKDSLKARLGAAPLTAEKALSMLGYLMENDSGNLAVADFDWHAMARLLPSSSTSRFTRLRREAGKAVGDEEQDLDFASLILDKTPEEIHEIVKTMVTVEVSKILGVGADRIDPVRSLIDLGMDSLMGIELALGLEQRFGIKLPAMMLNEGPTVERVVARIVERIVGGNDDHEEEGGEIRAYVNAMAAQHGATSSEVGQVVSDIQENLISARGNQNE